MNNKFVIVGGGASHTPGILIALFEKRLQLNLKELVLYDINKDRVEKMGKFAQIFFEEKKSDVKVSYTTNIKEAFTGADFLFVQIRPGGNEQRELDEKIPLRNGLVGQETCGLGGFAFALRTIPKVLEIVEKALEICPNAWILNYSNPEAIISEAVHQKFPKAKMLCICDMPIAQEEVIANILNIPLQELSFSYFGLNHFGWFTNIYDKDGIDLLPKIRDDVKSGKITMISEKTVKNDFKKLVDLFKIFPDYLPICYLTYYIFPDELVEEENINYTRANYVMDNREKDVFLQCDEVINNKTTINSDLVSGVHGNYIVDVASAIINNTNEKFIINVKNNGSISNFSNDDVVEVPCVVSSHGVEPLAIGAIPTFCKSLMELQKGYEKLTVECVLQNSYEKAIQAIILNKTVPSYKTGKKVLDELIEANLEYFPKLN